MASTRSVRLITACNRCAPSLKSSVRAYHSFNGLEYRCSKPPRIRSHLQMADSIRSERLSSSSRMPSDSASQATSSLQSVSDDVNNLNGASDLLQQTPLSTTPLPLGTDNVTPSRSPISMSSQQQRPSFGSTTSDFIPPPPLQERMNYANSTNYEPVSVTDAPISTNTIIRQIHIPRRKDLSTQQHTTTNGETGLDNTNYRESLNGYKYRILKTPQLTNDMLTVPLPVSDIDVPITNPPTQSQLKEEDDFDMYLQHTPASSLQRSHQFPNGMHDVLSSRWWQTLYRNILHPSASSSRTSHPFQSSMRNRRSSLLLEEIINNDSYNTQHLQEEKETSTTRVRVRSVQAASSIDVVAVLSKVFGGGVARASQNYGSDGDGGESDNGKANGIGPKIHHPLSEFFASSPPMRHVFGRTNIIIQLSPPPSNCPPSLAPSAPRYVAIYRFGSVVFFNVTTKEASKLLEQIKKHSTDPIAVGFERREFFEMALQPQLEMATGNISADRAMVRDLDMNTVGIVSNIMGQTVALDWYNDTVDELLANFSNINSSVERFGNFTSMERNSLFQVVARNNSLFIDMVGKLGIKDRSDTAWHLSQYEALHDGMRKEFDLDERFKHIEFKLNLIQQNAKFFLEVLHAQKSNTLEWVIIVLISFECVLMCLDMSGLGAQFFGEFAYFKNS